MITDVIPLWPIVKIALPTIALLLMISTFAYHEFGNVVVIDGHYKLPVTLSNFDSNSVSGVTYTTINRDETQMVIDNYPSPEPVIKPIADTGNTLNVSFGYYASPLLKRELGYIESFDTVLFRIEYTDRSSEFRAIDVPARNSGEGIQLNLQRGITLR